MTSGVGQAVIVVSGLPRSGTSMMMSMLEAGGIEIFTDGTRRQDEDNPRGYYEVELVKSLKRQEDKSWLVGAKGKAIKVVSSLLRDLPAAYQYQVVFMNRKLEEIVASQNKMRTRRGDTSVTSDLEMLALYKRHLQSVKAWMRKQGHLRFMDVEYKGVIERSCDQADRIQKFLGVRLDVSRMSNVVDAALYRNRA